jgi:hypothetical protein
MKNFETGEHIEPAEFARMKAKRIASEFSVEERRLVVIEACLLTLKCIYLTVDRHGTDDERDMINKAIELAEIECK